MLRLLPELDFGGVESRVRLQAAHHDRGAYELRVCAFHKRGAAAREIEASGVPVDLLGQSPSVRNPRATFALIRYLRRTRPDIIHASIVEATVHASIATLLTRRSRLIVEEVGLPERGRLASAVLSQVYRCPDVLIGVTQATCDHMVEVDGAPRARVRLVYNCAAPEYFPDPPRPVSARGEGQFRLLAVGRLVPVKNQALLIEAVGRLRNRFPQLELWLAGEGPLAQKLLRRAAEVGLGESFTLLGYRSDVSNLLCEADAYLLPSHSEGCSISLMEAMATGVPVIASATPGNREVMGPLSTNWTVSATDLDGWCSAIATMASLPPSERAQLAAAAQALAYERFSPSAYLARLEGLYRELVASVG